MYVILKGHGVVEAKKQKDENRYVCLTTEGITVLCNSDNLEPIPSTEYAKAMLNIAATYSTNPIKHGNDFKRRLWYKKASESCDGKEWARVQADLKARKPNLSFSERKLLDKINEMVEVLINAIYIQASKT